MNADTSTGTGPTNNKSDDTTKSDAVSVGQKRALDDKNNDEKWVKRIQLDPVSCENDESYQRRKLRKFVLLLSYSGKGYLGMQRNPGYRTIEDDLLMAMLQGSLIKEEGVTCPQIYRFQRAARTDKGVSAARQIVSVKLPDDVEIPKVINEHLPEQIRVMKAVRVTQKFDAKIQCDSRSYSYLTPTFAFAPKDEVATEDYRMSPKVLQELRSILSLYKGTHNFHNFTARVKYTDPCANRYILDIKCSDPFLRNGMEWTMIKVKGQSFMLHQIRKMVGLSIAICRSFVSRDIFDSVWQQDRKDIPIAPSVGLVLEEPHYDYYNKKYFNDGIHDQLNWESEEPQIESFREKYIDSVIVNTEMEEKTMLKWLETLEFHNFNKRKEGGARGKQRDSADASLVVDGTCAGVNAGAKVISNTDTISSVDTVSNTEADAVAKVSVVSSTDAVSNSVENSNTVSNVDAVSNSDAVSNTDTVSIPNAVANSYAPKPVLQDITKEPHPVQQKL